MRTQRFAATGPARNAFAGALISCLISLALASPATAAAASGAAAKPAHTATTQLVVEYAELAHHVGERVAVRTNLNMNRSGTLVHWTGAAIQLKLDSGAVLDLPASAVRRASLVLAASTSPAPATAR